MTSIFNSRGFFFLLNHWSGQKYSFQSQSSGQPCFYSPISDQNFIFSQPQSGGGGLLYFYNNSKTQECIRYHIFPDTRSLMAVSKAFLQIPEAAPPSSWHGNGRVFNTALVFSWFYSNSPFNQCQINIES